jgi:thioredoxin 1
MKKIKYFTASWCGPCKSFKPTIQELINEGHDIEIIDVNQDQKQSLDHEIHSIPTLIFQEDGKTYNRSSGVLPKSEILSLISS